MKETLHIYTRVSTRVQDDEGTSLATQKELGIAKSKELKMKSKVCIQHEIVVFFSKNSLLFI